MSLVSIRLSSSELPIRGSLVGGASITCKIIKTKMVTGAIYYPGEKTAKSENDYMDFLVQTNFAKLKPPLPQKITKLAFH
jgi:hypothetical protein